MPDKLTTPTCPVCRHDARRALFDDIVDLVKEAAGGPITVDEATAIVRALPLSNPDQLRTFYDATDRYARALFGMAAVPLLVKGADFV